MVFLYDSSYIDCYRCSCGNCSRVVLQNLSECYYCPELDGCKEAMCSESVLEEIQAEIALRCITQHPVCLQKWSLRMAGERVKTKAHFDVLCNGREKGAPVASQG